MLKVLRQAMFKYIEIFYYPKRKHVIDGMTTSVEFRLQR